jgi:hypothetical protein|uniref:Peptidase C14 caspase domain-containing protein n=1 Tax=viral metagenome TaxID=1070528 RepID=A0A6C0IKY8_9ZZZZ
MVKVAVIIGVNYSKLDKSIQLNGCIYDARRIYETLLTRLGFSRNTIYMLTDDNEEQQPTKERIWNVLEKAKKEVTRTEDELWIYYSGHGNTIFDINGDEKYGRDSVILPMDYLKQGYIGDDEIHAWLHNIQCRVCMIFDSCHSGTITDLPWNFTYREPGEVLIEKVRDIEMENPHVYTLSSSLDSQTSWEVYNRKQKQSYGEFTNTLLGILDETQYNISIMKLFERLGIEFHTKQFGETGKKQTPTLSSSSRIPDWKIQT